MRYLQSALEPVSPLPPNRTIVLGLLVICSALALVIVTITGADAIHAMTNSQCVGVFALLAVGAIIFATSLCWQMVPGSLRRVPLELSILAFATGFLSGMALLFPWKNTEMLAFVAQGLRCFGTGLLVAIPAAAAVYSIARRGAVLSFGPTGVIIGALSGMVASAVIQLSCPTLDAAHLIVWHGAVVLCCAFFGFVAAKFWEDRERRDSKIPNSS